MPEQRVNILIYRPDGTLVAQYLLGDGEHLIGRDINCPIYLDSEYISSNHAKLHLSAEGIYIEDLNSTSGTFLDGVTVRGKLRIKPGQVLQVGDLTVDLQPESVDNVGPGSRLGDGRYTLIRLLGRGGMGEVWLAKDEQLDEEVALKKIPHEVAADAMALADMRREVQKSRGLTHQNIIRIHDLYFKPGEDPFISLEYVDGRDLTHIIATKTNGIFPWEEIKPLVLQLCEALEYAHGQKIVHRDLKPANLMITRDSQLKLADFGIAATMVDSLSRSSIQGFVSGTTLYMSPQQMEGEAPQASDDIYAFGATLYELLTSRPPFYTGDMQHQVQQVIPKPMEQRLQEFGFTNKIPEYVQQLVMSCLAKEPEGRPKSMGAIRKWIESEGKDKAAIPKPTTKTVKRAHTAREPLEPELTPAKKGAKYAALAAVIAVVIGLGFWAKNQLEELDTGQQRAQGPGTSKIKGNGEESTPINNPATNTNGATKPAPVTPTNPTTEETTPKPNPPVTQPVTPPVHPTTPATGTKKPGTLLWEFETGDWVTSSPAIGPDGTVYIGSWDAKIYALDGKTGAKKWDANVDMQVQSSPSIGPDGTIYIGAGRAFALDGKTGESLWQFQAGNNMQISPAIGSDGTIYVGAYDNKAYALDGKSGAKKWEYRLDIHVTISPAIGADGTVYTGLWDGKIYALNGQSGKQSWVFPVGGQHGAAQPAPAIGADGTICFGALNGKVYSLDGKTGEKKWEFASGKAIRSSPAIGSDGTVYIGSTDSKVYALNGKTGVKMWEFTAGGSIGSTPAIGADGTVYIGSSDSKVYALDRATGAKKWEFETGRDVISSPAISPEGILYIGSKDKKVYAIRTNSKGLAKSPWPMFGQNAQHTGRAMPTKNRK
jgi:outer membrane protein assembly factor BamB